MELTQLRYFQALAKSGNLTRTAKDLFISAPALSTSISRLEQEVGVLLFDRIKGRMYLNEYGQIFLQQITEGLTKLDSGKDLLRSMAQLEDMHLTLVTMNAVLWNGMIADFIVRYPNIHVTVIKTSSSILKKHVDIGRFDLLLGGKAQSYVQDLEWIPLFVDNTVMVCLPCDHPFAHRNSLKLIELKDEKFIFPPANFKLSEFYYRICREAGFEPDVIAECDYVLSSYLHKRGLGIALTSSRACQFDIFSDSVFVPVEDVKNDMAFDQNIYWNKQQKLNKPAMLFRDFAVEYCK